MTREEILKMAQQDSLEQGEYEFENFRNAALKGTALGVLMCVIMIGIEWLIIKQPDFGKPAIILAISAYMDILNGRKNESKRVFVKGIVKAVFAIFFTILYIGAMFV